MNQLNASIKIGIIIILLSNIIYSCKKDIDKSVIKKEKISGYVQKGPYVNGTSIEMYELSSSLSQTGKSFSTKISDNKGSFEISNIALSSQYVEFSASGYYFNEFTGDISVAPLTLYALSDITDIASVNVNILTHLEKDRVEYLVGKGKSFFSAKDSAQTEIMAIFGFSSNSMSHSENLDISQNTDENAVLLAISLLLQGDRSVGDLTELLANISTDIKQDGILNSNSILTSLRNSSKLLNLSAIRTNLVKRYQDLGVSSSIPGFEKYINGFLAFTGQKPTCSGQPATNLSTSGATINGVVNANSLSTVITFEYGLTTEYSDSTKASESPLSGSADAKVSATLSGLTAGMTYHYRLKVVNSLGTGYSSDAVFSIMGALPAASTLVSTNITTTEATLNGTVNANMLSSVVTFEYGNSITYGKIVTALQSPVSGNSNISVSSNITGLSVGTIYHFRVKTENSIGTTYGSDMTFTTLGQVPTASSLSASEVTADGSKLKGIVNPNYLSTTISFEYGLTTSYGSTITSAPNIVTGNSPTNTSADITGLSGGTTYHYRVVATNSLGTTNSNDITFTTLGQLPSTIALPATGVSNTEATLKGTVNANYLTTSVSFEYGFTTGYGSLADATPGIITGNTITSVNSIISGLSVGTNYHFRVKAQNFLGTTYSNDILVITVPTNLNDIDGNIYGVIKIGEQLWTSDNLKTTKFNDGTTIPLITDSAVWGTSNSPGLCWYSNDEAGNKNPYGALYNWNAVNTLKLCPLGWHVPTNEEFISLENYLITNGYNFDGTISGNKYAKSIASGSNWLLSSISGTVGNTDYPNKQNITGFSALPAGNRGSNGTYYSKGRSSSWWSTTSNLEFGYSKWNSSDNVSVTSMPVSKTNGFSIRCLRD